MASRGDIKFEEVQPKLFDNWLKLNFEETLDKTGSFTKLKSKDYFEEGEYPVIDQGDSFISGYINDEKLLYKGDLPVIIFGDHTRVVKYINFEFATGADGTKVLKPIKLYDNMFYYYYLKSLKIPSLGYSRHFKILKDLNVPLPPLAEQQRIVAKLDQLFTHLDTLKTRLNHIPQLLKNFRQAVLTQAVTGKLTEHWRVGKALDSYMKIITKNRKELYKERIESAKIKGRRKPKKLDETHFEFYNFESNIEIPKDWELANLKNIADLLTDGEHATPRRTESGYYLLSARNVRDGFISLEKVDYVPEDEYLRIKKRCNPEFKDVLISCSGSVGRVSTVPKNLECVMVRSAALVKLQSNKEISKFVELSLRSRIVQNQILTLQKSTAQANLFLGQIGKIVIPIPPKEEQIEIVKRVEHLFAKADKIETQYQNLKTKIDRLPQAILAKAFKGELVPQLDTDGDAKELLAEIEKLKAAAQPKKKKVVRKKKQPNT